MKINNIDEVLEALHLNYAGHYDSGFYIIDLQDSNEYSRVYTKLDKYAENEEYPNFGKNTANSTVNIVNYFNFSYEDSDYMILLFANFDDGTYFVKIKEIGSK